MLFRMIFGGGAFDDVFGELSMVTLLNPENESGKTEEEMMAALNKKMEEQCILLEAILVKKLAALEERQNLDSMMAEITEKLEAPGGPALLDCVGYIYISESKKGMGRFLGVEGWFASMEETSHNIKQTFSIVSSVVKLQEAQRELEKQGETPDQTLTTDMVNHGLDTMWKLGKMEIEKTCRAVCQAVIMKDKVPKDWCWWACGAGGAGEVAGGGA
eukprot:TRINITY_DN11245_c0_g1_i3.p1 TRINITY_DN11245_c0_g1~~TRINITY_DN11245_c0_g1_i3.p1  ORF type:complete len:216 (+),score=65.91 TRINITY_DN11245_c0_g1_i3:551-1198(+)